MKKIDVPSIDKNAELEIEKITPGVVEIPIEERKGKIIFIIGTIVSFLILIGVIVLGYFYFKTPKGEIITTETIPTPTIQIIETSRTELKKEKITFEVLNASGKTGEASKIKNKLELMGYKVNKIGNSNNKTTGFSFYISKQIESQKDDLLNELKKDFPTIKYAGELTESDSLCQIIIGN